MVPFFFSYVPGCFSTFSNSTFLFSFPVSIHLNLNMTSPFPLTTGLPLMPPTPFALGLTPSVSYFLGPPPTACFLIMLYHSFFDFLFCEFPFFVLPLSSPRSLPALSVASVTCRSLTLPFLLFPPCVPRILLTLVFRFRLSRVPPVTHTGALFLFL